MLRYTALGTQRQVTDYLEDFLRQTRADELIVVHQAPTIQDRLRSVTLLGNALQNRSAS
jgi:hypothetical protein